MSIYRYIQEHADEIYAVVDETYRWRYQNIEVYTSASRNSHQRQLSNTYSDLLLSATTLSIEVATSGVELGEGRYADFIRRLLENFGTYELLAVQSVLQFVDTPTIDMEHYLLKATLAPLAAEEGGATIECPICYCEISIRDALVIGCQHKFCKTCLFRWIDRGSIHKACGCPMCRYEISEIYTASEEHFRFMTERFAAEEEAFASRTMFSLQNHPGHNIS